jgi:signal transduction histidine kinase
MDRWRRLLGPSMRIAGIGFAALLLIIDVAGGGVLPALSGAIVATLALRTTDLARRIVAALAVTVAGDIAAAALAPQDGHTFGLTEAGGLGLLLVLATRYLQPRRARWAVPAISIAVLMLPLRLGPDQSGLTFVLAVCVATAIALGGLLRAQDTERAAAVDRVRSDERLSLARDLHDSVAHHVTGIVVRAQAAQVVAAQRPTEAVDALAAIEHEGLATLTSMRRLVGVLREPDPERLPPAGLAQIHDLVTRFAAGGLPATLSASPEAAGAEIPDEVGAAVHRVVQEALTNVRRHARRPTRVTVEMDLIADDLHVRVRDDGHDHRSGAGTTGGFGLVGLEERVRALGGRMSVGPMASGGWEVAAMLPLTRSERPSPASLLPGSGPWPQGTRRRDLTRSADTREGGP